MNSCFIHNKKKLNKDAVLLLMDNVQFIYELSLAQLELRSLGVSFKLTNGLREFKLLATQDDEELIKKLAYFKSVRNKLPTIFK